VAWGEVFFDIFERDTKYVCSLFILLRAIIDITRISLSVFHLKKMRRILMPIDSTGEDVEVLNWVMDNVHRPGDEIVLLHV
jgi:hypothetical protein